MLCDDQQGHERTGLPQRALRDAWYLQWAALTGNDSQEGFAPAVAEDKPSLAQWPWLSCRRP